MAYPVHTTALQAHQAGLVAIPAATDGTKAPLGRWRKWQTQQPTRNQIDTWFADGHPGIGFVCGEISGGLELLEFEGRAITEGIWDGFIHAAQGAGLLDLVDRICDGYLEETPTGGHHLLYRCPGHVTGNQKLARRPATDQELDDNPDDRIRVLIETRGEGGFVIVAPSNGTTHPTGRPWELHTGGPTDIATISPDERQELHRLAATFDTLPDPHTTNTAARHVEIDGTRPGDDYNQQTTWETLLGAHGWTYLYTRGGVGYWQRPGKTTGVSATTNGSGLGTNRLKVFSTSTPFDTETTYDHFGAYAVLEHAGDHSIAARQLRADGYGQPPSPPTTTIATTDGDNYPTVIINNKQFRMLTLEFLDRIVDENQPPVVFIHGGRLSRVTLDEHDRPNLEAFGEYSLRGRIARVCNPRRRLKDGEEKDVPPPMDNVRDLKTLNDWPEIPSLEGIVEIPTLRADGTIHTDAGYDPTTRLLHVPDPALTVDVADQPTTHDVAQAVELLHELLCDFPFETPADHANTLGMLLTPLVRPAVTGQTPLALVDSPEPGTGKGLLANLTNIVATGRQATMRLLPRHEEEIRKTLTSVLLEAPQVVVLDNISTTIRSPALAAILTTDNPSDRLLGQSKTVHVPNRATWIATGNNLAVGGDLARRCYRIRLDAKQARPYLRTGFRHEDLIGWATTNRGRIISSLLTLARHWWTNNQPAANRQQALGGFSDWSRIVGGILTHAGIDGFLDNFIDLVESVDTESAEWESFLATWHDTFRDEPVTTVQVVHELENPSGELPLVDTLPADAAGKFHSPGFNRSLGKMLRARAGRHFGDDGWHIEKAGETRQKVVQWRVERSTQEKRGVCGVRGIAVSQPLDKIEEKKYQTSAETNPAQPRKPRAPTDICADCSTTDIWITDADTNDPLCRRCARTRGTQRLQTEHPHLLTDQEEF